MDNSHLAAFWKDNKNIFNSRVKSPTTDGNVNRAEINKMWEKKPHYTNVLDQVENINFSHFNAVIQSQSEIYDCIY